MVGCPRDLKQWWPILRSACLYKKTYSDYLWAAREVEKEESMELSCNPCSQAIGNTAKPKSTSFFPLQKLKGNQPLSKTTAVHLAHLEEESPKGEEEDKPQDPDGIDRVMEEFMVHLAWAMKDAQVEEKCCYHCRPLRWKWQCPRTPRRRFPRHNMI